MTELLFILTVLFIAYIVYTLSAEQKAKIKVTPPEIKPVTLVTEQKIAVPEETKTPIAVILQEVIKLDIKTPEVVPQHKAITVIDEPIVALSNNQQDMIKREIRNPKTGEIATPHGNYQFTKRWIKEALVAEGLVAKVYKSNELSSDIEAQIKVALTTLAVMDNYRVS